MQMVGIGVIAIEDSVFDHMFVDLMEDPKSLQKSKDFESAVKSSNFNFANSLRGSILTIPKSA